MTRPGVVAAASTASLSASACIPAGAAAHRPEHFFAPCPRGLEQVFADELHELGIAAPAAVPGGVAFSAGMDAVYRVNHWSRIASRVLLRVAEGSYANEEDIYQLALAQDWRKWFETSYQPVNT